MVDEGKAYFCWRADGGVEAVQSRLGKVNDELCDDRGASMNQSGLRRSTTDLGVCAKDRATTHTCIMSYHMDLPVIGWLYNPPAVFAFPAHNSYSLLHATRVFLILKVQHLISVRQRRWLHKEECTGEEEVGAAGESVAGKPAVEVEEAG